VQTGAVACRLGDDVDVRPERAVGQQDHLTRECRSAYGPAQADADGNAAPGKVLLDSSKPARLATGHWLRRKAMSTDRRWHWTPARSSVGWHRSCQLAAGIW
jgi:hypothetical protein